MYRQRRCCRSRACRSSGAGLYFRQAGLTQGVQETFQKVLVFHQMVMGLFSRSTVIRIEFQQLIDVAGRLNFTLSFVATGQLREPGGVLVCRQGRAPAK